jgi:hypothetical protein
VRNYAPVGNVYREVLTEARLKYPVPAAGSILVLRNPDPGLVAEQYVEAMVRLEYDRPDLHVTLVNAQH